MSESTGTTATTHSIQSVSPVEAVSVCGTYGHEWERTQHPDVKACPCGIREYCSGYMPVAPPNAQPFLCTTHTGQREV